MAGRGADPNVHLSSGPPGLLGSAATAVLRTALNGPTGSLCARGLGGVGSLCDPPRLGAGSAGTGTELYSLPFWPHYALIPRSCSVWVFS